MRKLKTPEEIKASVHPEHYIRNEFLYKDSDVDELIKAAQRDALECAAENVKLSYDDHGYPEFMPIEKLNGIIQAWDLKVDRSGILTLMHEL